MNMLGSLRTIVQEVNSARSLPEVLSIIVKEVRASMQAGVCSVYLFDETDERYVLMATEGLREESIGKVRMSMREGLVGLVAAKEEPLNLEDADRHPNFAYFEETGESPFHSFLGVPIIHHRKVLGVLVLQQQTQRRFASEEEAFVVTVCAQLSGAIAHAEATGALRKLASAGRGKSREATFRGIPSSPGVGIGRVVLVSASTDLSAVPERFTNNPAAEVEIFRKALAAAKKDMRNLGDGLVNKLSSEELALFDVYIRMLDDSSLGGEVIAAITAGQAAQSAWSSVILKHVRTFRQMEDPYLRERAADVNDLGKRVLGYLQTSKKQEVPMPRRVVLVGEDLSATALADIPVNRLVGIISLKGSSNSHMAIVGRALGIPTVMGAIDLPWAELEGQELIVDGFTGDVVSSATRSLRRSYLQRQREEKILNKDLQKLRDIPCITPDGFRFSLWVNTGLRQDTMMSLKSGAEAVGLFRTEMPFMVRSSFPTEDEQVAIYREQLVAFSPRPVTMRTLDIGGDKDLPYFPIEEIEVPAAVYQVKEIGRRVDFLSVGTNDLTQYLLAVDRNNPRVADLYHTLHPAVLRALKVIYEQASSVNCQLSVCGEMAGDPLSAVVLLGLGYENFSMSASTLLRVKSVLLNISRKDARELVKRALRLSDAAAVADFMSSAITQPEIAKLIRPTGASQRSEALKQKV